MDRSSPARKIWGPFPIFLVRTGQRASLGTRARICFLSVDQAVGFLIKYVILSPKYCYSPHMQSRGQQNFSVKDQECIIR